jgi:3-oxoacyl-[acyl-carrier-protein] synthase II
MNSSAARVVVTGLGVSCPMATGQAELTLAMREGRSGIAPIVSFPVPAEVTPSVGEIPNFDPRAFVIPRLKKTLTKSLKYMARDIQLAVGMAQVALSDAGLADGGVDPTRIGLDLGAGIISTELQELSGAIEESYRNDDKFDYRIWGDDGIKKIQPIWLLKYLPNMLACHISILSDCQGPSNTITSGDASAGLAIGEAYRILRKGRADVMISGGADSKIHPLSYCRAEMLGLLSDWTGDPHLASRPFDAKASGLVLGEGSGILIMESLAHAENRSAKVYGEILGIGAGTDAVTILQPLTGKGMEIAIRAALREAGLEPTDPRISHICAHGIGVPSLDAAEATAIRTVFAGRPNIPVTSLKGGTGNMGAGNGGVEVIANLLALREGFVPPTLNCDDPVPEYGLNIVRGKPLNTDGDIFLSLNLTRYGQASCVIAKAWPKSS